MHRGRGAERLPSEALDEKAKSRRRIILLVTPIAVLFVAATLASAFTPALAADHPLLLIVLEARNRNLVLARHVDIVPFVLVAVTRRMLTDPLYFLLGHYYGDNAVGWVEKKFPAWGPMLRWTEKLFAKASYPMVFFFPGALVCALAGASGMKFVRFLVVNLAGTVFAVVMLRAFGDIVGGPVDWLLDFFRRYTWQLTAASFTLVVVSFLLARVEVPTVDELEAELEGKPDEADGSEEAKPETRGEETS